nr:hypothetical protein [Streptococcus ruminantium]
MRSIAAEMLAESSGQPL